MLFALPRVLKHVISAYDLSLQSDPSLSEQRYDYSRLKSSDRLTDLPTELLSIVASYCPPSTLQSLRLVSHRFEPISNDVCFSHLKFTHQKANGGWRLHQICLSDKLRGRVEAIGIDSTVFSDKFKVRFFPLGAMRAMLKPQIHRLWHIANGFLCCRGSQSIGTTTSIGCFIPI